MGWFVWVVLFFTPFHSHLLWQAILSRFYDDPQIHQRKWSQPNHLPPHPGPANIAWLAFGPLWDLMANLEILAISSLSFLLFFPIPSHRRLNESWIHNHALLISCFASKSGGIRPWSISIPDVSVEGIKSWANPWCHHMAPLQDTWTQYTNFGKST